MQNSSLIFFFSSRRRHTSFDCDWSSDVCSSDLAFVLLLAGDAAHAAEGGEVEEAFVIRIRMLPDEEGRVADRSEERRVGKECSVQCDAELCKHMLGWDGWNGSERVASLVCAAGI